MPWPENLFEELKRLRARRTWTEPRPVYVATGMIVMAAVLMLVVVSGVKQPAVPVPTSPQVRLEAPPGSVAAVRAADRRMSGPAVEPVAAGPRQNDKPRRPVPGPVTVAFGWQQHPLYGDWRYHPGADLAAPPDGVVRAVWGGRVTEVYLDKRYGLTVAVAGNGHTVYYGSLARATVDRHQQIAAGAAIGIAGEAPEERYPHLHLAVKNGERFVDPQEILAESE
jgi:murein DD-endopeptidase MepM/ murein hydrolase activator NlpD